MTELFDSYGKQLPGGRSSPRSTSPASRTVSSRAPRPTCCAMSIARRLRAGRSRRHARCRLRRRQLFIPSLRGHCRPPERYRRFLGQHRRRRAADNHDVDYRAFDGRMLSLRRRRLRPGLRRLRHAPRSSRMAHFMNEMRRVVRPGGLVCVIEHNPLNPLTRLAVTRCAFDRDAVLLRAGKTRQLLRDAGLRQVSHRISCAVSVAPSPPRLVSTFVRRPVHAFASPGACPWP